MKKQVLVIHGGDAFATYEEYLSFLRNYEVDLESLKRKGWKEALQEKLGNEYEVIAPKMPNKSNAKYIEWKIWFEKYLPFVNDGVILLGHSMGGSFLAKYLSEEKFPKKIHATFLVSAPYDIDEDRALVEFVPPDSLSLLEEQGGEVFLYHSKDDPLVPFGELEKYQRALPKARVHTFEDRGHFGQEEFSEIIQDLQSLS